MAKYKQPDLPEVFILSESVDGEDLDFAKVRAADFVSYEPDKGALINWAGDRPIIMRVVRQVGDVLTVRDGTGQEREWKIWPVPTSA